MLYYFQKNFQDTADDIQLLVNMSSVTVTTDNMRTESLVLITGDTPLNLNTHHIPPARCTVQD